jgi:predicted TIM-barrel fold metal-dependent hydrolase
MEALPRSEARELIDAHLDGVQGFGEGFAAWGPLALDGACAEDVDELLDRGCVGVSLPAGALSPPDALDRLHSVFTRVEQRNATLFIHPGLGVGQRPAEVSLRDPLWWAALTTYVAQMQAAWLSLATVSPRIYPRLRIVFAMLAGGAPLLSERLSARGGPGSDVHSRRHFFDTSSYGPVAVQAMADRVGADQLLFGSDRPVVEPTPTHLDAALRRNGAWLAPPAGVASA